MKTVVVVFTRNNARVITNPDSLLRYRGLPNVAINPDLSLVEREPPHFWKQQGGKIVPMTRPEKLLRLRDHDEYGVDNNLAQYKPRFHNRVLLVLGVCKPLVWACLGAAITFGVNKWLT